jgi:hypothetical protein
MKWLACVVLVVPVLAFAGPTKKQLEWTLTNRGDDADTAVKLGFDSEGVHDGAKTWEEANRDRRELVELRDPTIATAADGRAAWAATTARRGSQCAGLTGTIDKCKDYEEPSVAVLLLYEQDAKDKKRWNPVVVHSAIPLTAKDYTKRVADAKLDPIANKIDSAAEPAVAVFKASLADPKALATSVSKRKDVVLLGSAPKEKFVGGAKVAATLAKWKLALSVRDGIAAGVTTSKTVAWVATNVDAKPESGATTPYRVLALYELEKGKDWHLVALSFSYTSAKTE